MKLVSFSVKNYRSIKSTAKLPIRDTLTVLVGPNNEGKSNVLRALVTALDIASRLDSATVRAGRIRTHHSGRGYSWPSDYPVGLQASKPDGESEFDLEFQLSDTEINEFWTEVRSSLNGTLPVRITVGKGAPGFAVRKKGPGGKALSAKASKIAQFIGRRIGYEHIPAVRPAETATRVVEDLLERELQALNADPDYALALQRIEELQLPVLSAISTSVRDTLKVFLPNVKDVQVHAPREARVRALSRYCEVIVDDGTPTALAYKGDGVQSLAALSLMRHASQSSAQTKQLVLAIEEPESHLHPNASHELRNVLLDIAKQHQVIITTHCPLFVDRHDARANILVTDSHAACAVSIRQIRETMGVRLSDNLVAAEVLLLVEGESDRKACHALLPAHSKILEAALKSGLLGIDTLGGGTNLSYKLTQAREAMCTPHALIDNDTSGQAGVARAMKEGLLQLPDLTYTNSPGMAQSELEDWYDSTIYAPTLVQHFGVPATSPKYTATTKKWTERMKELFQSAGKPWDSIIESQVKARVADVAASNPKAILLAARKSAFESLVATLEAKVK